MDARTQPPRDVAGFDPVATAGDCWFDADAADRATDFIETSLCHTKGKRFKGKPFLLEGWQRDYIRTLFGWKRPDGLRRFRVSFLFIPRKNGKSQIAAAIALYVLFCDGEAEAECYCAAGTRDQASIVFRAAASMIRANGTLEGASKIRDSLKRIIYEQQNSFIVAIPTNEGSAHGFNAHVIVGDELHTWPNRDFYDTLHTSTGSRDEALEVYITTAGYDITSICHEVYRRAVAVRDGVITDPEFLPAVFEAGPDDDWEDPATWRKANPNIGVSVREDYIAAECKKAKENPSYENTFRRLHLNQWTGQDERWLPMKDWAACPATADLPDAPLYGGLDLSSVRDFTAFALMAKTERGYHVRCHYWAPSERIEYLERKYSIPLFEWVRAGWVTPIQGSTIDYGPIVEHIAVVQESADLQAVGYDPYNAHAVRLELEDKRGVEMHECRQGFLTLSGPSKQLERCVVEHTFDHSGDPVLAWMADNVRVRRDENGNLMPSKGKDKNYRLIDGIAATVMAIREADAGVEQVASVFDSTWDF
ncbi:MAG: terminase TerL endonuclease subunit [Planctomycetota bacterium]